jgi:hypothetical protein
MFVSLCCSACVSCVKCENARNIDPANKGAESIDFVAITPISLGSRFGRNKTPSGALIFPRNQRLSPDKGWGHA